MRLRFAVLAALALGSPLHADNYLANGAFRDDLSGWATTGAAWTHESSGVYGWAEVTSTGSGLQTLSQCAPFVGFPTGRSVAVGGYANTVGHSSPVQYEVELFATANCTGGALTSAAQPVSSPTADTWALYYVPVTVPAGTQSARVTASVTSSAANQTTQFDTISLRSDFVTNGNFTHDLTFWVPTPTNNWSQVDEGASEPLGVAEGTVSGDGSLYLAQCISLENFAWSPQLFSVIRVKALDTVTDQTYLLSYQFHSGGCGGTLLSQPGYVVTPSQAGVWESFLNLVYPPPTSDSVVIYFALNPGQGTPGTRLQIDDFVLSVSDVIHWSFFETGDLVEWSNSVP